MTEDTITGTKYNTGAGGSADGLFPATDVFINEGEAYSILGSNQDGSYTSAYYYNDNDPHLKIFIPTFKNAFNEIVEPVRFYFRTSYSVFQECELVPG
jgi:hypothetical protein